MHLHHEYGLLAPEETMGGPANAGAQVRGAVHGAISGTADDWWTETEMGEETGQRTLLARGMQENGNEDQIPPQPVTCAYHRRPPRGGRRGETPHPAACAYGAQPGVGGGPPYTAVNNPSARPWDAGGGGTLYPAACKNRMWAGEGGGKPIQSERYPSAQPGEEKEGDPPELQCAQLVCWKRRDEITHTRQRDTPACIQGGEDEGNPPKLQCAHIVHGM